jgi:hypothetical protein
MTKTTKPEQNPKSTFHCPAARQPLAVAAGWRVLLLYFLCTVVFIAQNRAISSEMKNIKVSKEHRTFILEEDGCTFTPWGFNYDHDEQGRLIEDYWKTEWPKVEEDFREMKELGANVVRIHLQLAKFMDEPNKPNDIALGQLTRLLMLAEQTQLYLDITGLGCYNKEDVPVWYDELSEKDRWGVQAHFWETIARQCANSPAIFCYDLMNEPIIPGNRRGPREWLGPPFGGKYFVQFITLDPADRPRHLIARQWIQQMVSAIRKHDGRHLITVGLVSWSLERPGLTSGFQPEKIVSDVNFLSVHLYPEKSRPGEAIDTLKGFSLGKPLVIEETFPLKCPLSEFERFLANSRAFATGWIGFYWGKKPEECRLSKEAADALMLAWLEVFQKKAGANTGQQRPR